MQARLRSFLTVLFGCLFPACVGGYAEITYLSLADKQSSIWDTDSLYLGLGFRASKYEEISVTWKSNQAQALGELYFMVPGEQDSALFLFSNETPCSPSSSCSRNVGRHLVGTPLIFMYMVTDTSQDYASVANLKLYSGQNRHGIDPYFSELEKPGLQHRWACAGRVDSSTCEMSFAGASVSFREIRFHVKNAYREELEKYRPEGPVATPAGSEFLQSTSVTLASHTVGNPQIYYTLDGSAPDTTSELYRSGITIENTTTLKAIAIMPGDTQWIESAVTVQTYTLVPNNVRGNTLLERSNTSFAMQDIHNIKGQRIPIRRGNMSHHTSSIGVYILISYPKGLRQTTKRILYR